MTNFIIDLNNKKSKINKEIYGHFSEHLGRCIYEGIYVGENSEIPNINGMRTDVVEALKELNIPVLRWPGGCFADEYHWKDGIGPKENRKKMVNTHWGGVVEDNSFGTHEFMELCRQLGCEPYINGNLGSGTVQEMAEWVEYMTFDGVSPMAKLREENGEEKPWKVKYFGVGNENWGCGGNMTPEYYADEYRRYQTYCRNFGDNKLYKIACGANTDDYKWTEVLMQKATNFMDGLSLHYYTVPFEWDKKGSALDFSVVDYYITISKTLKMEELVTKHGAIMDKYDPEKRVGMLVDEWGTWFDVEPGTNPGFLYQQNTMRDAMVAVINLNIFNKHSDRVKMANIAQVVNVLQSVILTEGASMLKTPTYYVFKMMKGHQEATLVESLIQTTQIGDENAVPNLHESVSVSEDGIVNITLANISHEEEYEINTIISGLKDNAVATATILSQKIDAFNDFGKTEVEEVVFSDFTLAGEALKFTIPACSVVQFSIK